jgi:Zn-dependent M16 (insulinase) family peptidase
MSVIKYPSEDEDFGWVAMAWRLPGNLADNYQDIHALSILSSYLSSTSVSPLMTAFVEIADPLATDVDIDILMNAESAISIDFENVPLNKMDLIEDKFVAALNSVYEDGINMDRLHTIIQRMVLSRKMNLENSPHLVVPDPAVLDMLYGNKPDQFYHFIKEAEEEAAKKILEKPESFWLDMINVTFSRPKVMTKAYPSADLSHQLSSNETRRLKDQKATLGPEGLLASGKSIKEAIKSQVLPPPEVLKSIPVADVNSIQFRKMTYYNYTSKSQPEGFELKKIPFNFHLDDINSQFVRFYAFLDTNGISREDRYYLVLLTELWLQSPLRKTNGTIEPYESVLQRRSKDAMSFYNDLGYKGSTFNPGSNSHLIMFYCEAQMSKYEEAVQLLKETLFDVEFNVDKAKTLISQLLNSIPSVKLSTSKMTSALFDNIYFNDKPNIYYASVLRQQKFLEGISKELQHHPASLISKLHQLRQQIVKPENMFVYMATSLDRLRTEHPNASSQPWTEMFDTPTNGVPERLLTRYPTISEHQYRDPKPSIKHGIIGQPGTESCNLKQSIPYDVTDWEIQDVAAMRVMLQYLSDRMYDKIRGKGLTYGISMASSVTEGRTTVSFSRSSQLLDAYARFRQILKNYSSPVGGL